jgi:bacterial/archaeal transporter family protein
MAASPSGAFPTWLIFALLAAVFAALTNIFGKIGVADIPSNMATWVRVIVIFVVTSGIVALQNEWINPATMPRRTLVFLVLSGIATGLSWLCGYRALQLGQASQVAPVDKLSVLLVMILGVVFLKESLNWKQWLGGALILAGVILVAMPTQAKVEVQTSQTANGEP